MRQDTVCQRVALFKTRTLLNLGQVRFKIETMQPESYLNTSATIEVEITPPAAMTAAMARRNAIDVAN